MECTLVKSALGGEEVGKDDGKVSSSDEKFKPLRGAVGETILSYRNWRTYLLASSQQYDLNQVRWRLA
jgi:hypothetical protein